MCENFTIVPSRLRPSRPDEVDRRLLDLRCGVENVIPKVGYTTSGWSVCFAFGDAEWPEVLR